MASIDLSVTRTTPADPVAVQTALRTAVNDAAASVQPLGFQLWHAKKGSAWTSADTAAAQAAIDAAPALTPELAAQRAIDAFPIEYRALVLALVDQINVIRAALPTPLPAVTPAQA